MSGQALASRPLLGVRADTVRHGSRESTGFEEFLREILAIFVRCRAIDIDREIERWMARMVAELEVDRSNLFQVDNPAGTLLNTHHWSRPGIPTLRRFDAFKAFPWIASKVLVGKVVQLSSVSDIPCSAVVDRESYRRHGLRSHVIVPLLVGRRALGGLAFASLVGVPDWTTVKMRRLKLVASVFANALMRKHAVLERRNLLDEYRRVGRASMVGELAASVAHEINQPIAALIANAEAAKRFLAAPQPGLRRALEAVVDIECSVTRANEVIGRIQSLFRSAETKRSTVSVRKILADVSDLLQLELVSREIELRIDLATDLPPLLVDRVQICQVMTNVLTNAFDAMADNGARPRRVEIAGFQKHRAWLTITISDTGGGVEPSVAARIFDAFITSKPTGVGMGLAICRSIVKAHGGTMRLAASSSHGATFEIRLPVHGEQE